MRVRCLVAYFLVLLPLAGQGLHLDSIAVGPLLIHDHVRFDFHIPVLDDPFPHEFIQGYGYDGADLGITADYHWQRRPWRTTLRITPASRRHFAFDQDTDFRPGTNFTHGNAGDAKSRTFGIGQSLPLVALGRWGWLSYQFDYTRQWSRFHDVTTYDLNSNPALPSNRYIRVIGEHVIVHELRSTLLWSLAHAGHAWDSSADFGATPLTGITLKNYIPVILATDIAKAYGGNTRLTLTRHLGASWGLRLAGEAGWYNSYQSSHGFRREVFGFRLEAVRRR